MISMTPAMPASGMAWPNSASRVVPAGSTGSIPYPSLTRDLHHEIELVVAMGPDRQIFGYAVGLDMTRRDLQNEMKKQGRPWSIGKAFEHAAPIGPLHRTAVTGEMTKGAITLSVNGELRQKGDLADLIWSVNETIAQLSAAWTLAPGDLIFTGTPAGVGAVVPGDVITGRIEGLGEITLTVGQPE